MKAYLESIVLYNKISNTTTITKVMLASRFILIYFINFFNLIYVLLKIILAI
jgi:hypothetical protein